MKSKVPQDKILHQASFCRPTCPTVLAAWCAAWMLLPRIVCALEKIVLFWMNSVITAVRVFSRRGRGGECLSNIGVWPINLFSVDLEIIRPVNAVVFQLLGCWQINLFPFVLYDKFSDAKVSCSYDTPAFSFEMFHLEALLTVGADLLPIEFGCLSENKSWCY